MSPVKNNKWNAAPADFSLNPDQIHIWSIALDIDIKTQIKYWKVLSEEERQRADSFKFLKDKIKYVACRGVLRQLMGKYLGERAKSVSIEYIKNGKPHHNSNFEFNVSHSKDMAVIAFTYDTILGIDIEFIHRKIEFDQIAKRFFSSSEAEIVINASQGPIHKYFYNCWTRKEAFIKALGDGLSFPLDQFEVSCTPDDVPKLLSTKWDEKEVEEWSLWAFEKNEDYVGALAVRGPEKQLSYFTWDHEKATL